MNRNALQPALTSGRTAALGFGANLLLAAIKLCAGLIGHSMALVADAVESFTDLLGSIITWSGVRFAERPADETHPWGHGKAEALAAFVVGILIVIAGAGIALGAIQGINGASLAPEPFTLWVLIAVVITKEALFRVARAVARRQRSTAILADAWHHRSDAITSLAAFFGISVAIYGGPDYAAADDWAALFASGIVVFNGVRLVSAPLQELMDTHQADLAERAGEIALRVDGVLGVEKVMARKSGGSSWIDMHVEVDPSMPVSIAHEIGHRVDSQVRRECPEVLRVLVHIEPFSAESQSR